MRYPSNIGVPGGFSPVPIPFNPHYPPPPPPQMPVSVTYHYEDGSFSGPQMIQTSFPIDNGYREFSLNPNASEFIPSYWRPEVQPPYNGNGSMMSAGIGNNYEESYNYGQDDMSYVPSSSGATPTPILERDEEPPNYSVYTMPPSEQNVDIAGNSQTLPKASPIIVHQVPNANTTDTIEATEQCKDTCCSPKESLANDEAPAAVKTPKVATTPDDDDAKKNTEKIEVVPVPVQAVTCFPLYGFIGFHYGLPEPPMPEPQKLIKITPLKDGESPLVGPPSPKSTPKEQVSPPVPQLSVMPLPPLPIPQMPAIVPNNYQPLPVTPSKNGANPGQYTCFPPGFVKVGPRNVHFVHPSKVHQESGK